MPTPTVHPMPPRSRMVVTSLHGSPKVVNSDGQRPALAWTLANVVAFQLNWFAMVRIGPQWPALAAALLGVWLVLHLWRSPQRRLDGLLFAVLVAFGPLLDLLIERVGWLDYHGLRPHPAWPPWWILGLWGGFALTLAHSLSGILRRPLLSAVFGALGGAMAYWVGTRFGAATLPQPVAPALAGIGACWGAAMLGLSLALRGRLAREQR